MADTEAPEVQDTPVTPEDSAPEGTPDDTGSRTEEAVDYEKRFKDLQPELTRAQQERAQYESYINTLRDPETRAEALELLGIELAEDEVDDDYDDDPYESRFERIEQFLQQTAEAQSAAEAEQLFEQYVEQEFDRIDPNEELSDEDVEWILRNAPTDEDDIPDIEAGKKKLDAFIDAKFKAMLKAKKAPQAPSGASPNHQPDLDDDEARREYIAQRMSEINA